MDKTAVLNIHDIPDTWTILAEIDESESYEVDRTLVYDDGEKIQYVRASGCSCWEGEIGVTEFSNLLGLAQYLFGAEQNTYTYYPNLKTSAKLLAEAFENFKS